MVAFLGTERSAYDHAGRTQLDGLRELWPVWEALHHEVVPTQLGICNAAEKEALPNLLRCVCVSPIGLHKLD